MSATATTKLETLRERALRRLANPPTNGIHDWLYSCAASMHEAGFNTGEKFAILKERCRNLRRPVPEIEITKTITGAEINCASKWPGALEHDDSPIPIAPPAPAC